MKRFLLTIITLITAISISACSCSQSEDQFDKKNDIFNNITSYSKDTNPTLWDAYNGALGWHTNVADIHGEYYAFIIAGEDVYLTYNHGEEGKDIVLPSFNRYPLKLNKSSYNYNVLIDELNSCKEPYEESGIKYYVLTNENLKNSRDFCGINLDELVDVMVDSSFEKDLENGVGYDTDLLRDKFSERSKYWGININDSYWDEVNYKSRIKCERIDDSKRQENGYQGDFVVLEPVMTKVVSDYPEEFTYKVNGVDLGFDKDVLDGYLQSQGFESIDDSVKSKRFVNHEQYEEMLKSSK